LDRRCIANPWPYRGFLEPIHYGSGHCGIDLGGFQFPRAASFWSSWIAPRRRASSWGGTSPEAAPVNG